MEDFEYTVLTDEQVQELISRPVLSNRATSTTTANTSISASETTNQRPLQRNKEAFKAIGSVLPIEIKMTETKKPSNSLGPKTRKRGTKVKPFPTQVFSTRRR
jgi:hypothetical protein